MQSPAQKDEVIEDAASNSYGCLAHVAVSGKTATFSGWATAGFARPSSHRVFLGEQELRIDSIAEGLSTPDVARLFPSLAGAEACAFRIEASLPEGFRPDALQLFAYESTFPSGPGRRFFYFINPRIPAPSKALEDSIGGNFVAVGYEFLGFAYNFLRLRPQHALLDAGCGIGRMAYGLATYLDAQGRYEGFDIAPEMIAWAQANITPHHPNFRFQVADVFNSYYNPHGRSTSGNYVFPYADATFDAATLMSVFTHMDYDGVDNYFGQLARVVKPGGRVMVTAFLLDDESRASMKQGSAAMNFKVPYGKFWSTQRDRPEAAVAIDSAMFFDMARRRGLSPERRFPGVWAGRKDALTLQDLMILRR